MAAAAGRSIALEWDETPIAGVREKSIALNGEPIDVTSDDDNGWRHVLEDLSQVQVDITVTGVTKDDTLRAAWFGTRVGDLKVTFPDGGTIEGEFVLGPYTESGSYNDAHVFEATFSSNGVVTYTPPGS